MKKKELLSRRIQHIDITKHNPVPMVDAMGEMAFQARNLSRAAHIYDMMLADKECAVYLTLAGSLISAGLKKVIVDLVKNNMVDGIISTGANIVDQDFFEALGFHHYHGTQFIDDTQLREQMIDRIYDTFIDEEDLRVTDDVMALLCNEYLERRPYSSREFIQEMGRWLDENDKYKTTREESIVWNCYKKQVPIFCPAFSDCSAGFGFVMHRHNTPTPHVSIDSALDFYELTQTKMHNRETGLLMIGGGVPKNFVQDVVVAMEVLGDEDAPMHKYAIQITVADERDGALSGSTLKEACSWGKVDVVHEQMVFSEATVALPLIAGYGYHKGSWKARPARKFNTLFEKAAVAK